MTPNEWDRRPRQPKGDVHPAPIFSSVGQALTAWESIEGEIATAYIGLIDYRKDGKIFQDDLYFRKSAFDARHGLVVQAIETNVMGKDCTGFREFVDEVKAFSPRRHEIAHGRVFNAGPYGFYLGPNNTLTRNYPDGRAIYQYTSADINFYTIRFIRLALAAKDFMERFTHRSSLPQGSGS
jgi:hypothetical protein